MLRACIATGVVIVCLFLAIVGDINQENIRKNVSAPYKQSAVTSYINFVPRE